MKTCKRCGQSKPHSDYQKDVRGADGFVARCRDCVYDVVKEYRRKHPGLLARDNQLQHELNEMSRPLATNHRERWCQYDVDILTEFYESESVWVIAEALGRTVASVRSKAASLKLQRPESRHITVLPSEQ